MSSDQYPFDSSHPNQRGHELVSILRTCDSLIRHILQTKPSLSAEQIAQLLLSARFGCGHDGVGVFFELLLEHTAKHGLSAVMQRAPSSQKKCGACLNGKSSYGGRRTDAESYRNVLA